MIPIPEGQRALSAWAALPGATREEATELADQGLAHPDPAVAAIVVGVVRNAEAPRVAALFLFPAAVWLAEIMAVTYAGGSIAIVSLAAGLPILLGCLWAAVALAVTMWLRRALPYGALGPSLRAVLETGPDVEPAPMTVTVRHWLRALVLVAAVSAVPLAAWTLLANDVEQRLSQSWQTLALMLLLYVASLAVPRIIGWLRPSRRIYGRLYPLVLKAEGVVFGRRPLVPWDNIDAIELEDGDMGIIRVRWRLRDGRELRYTDALSIRPEKIVAVARAYKGRLSSTSAVGSGL